MMLLRFGEIDYSEFLKELTVILGTQLGILIVQPQMKKLDSKVQSRSIIFSAE